MHAVEKYFKMSSAEILPRVLSIKKRWSLQHVYVDPRFVVRYFSPTAIYYCNWATKTHPSDINI